jgi:hypothetical protein
MLEILHLQNTTNVGHLISINHTRCGHHPTNGVAIVHDKLRSVKYTSCEANTWLIISVVKSIKNNYMQLKSRKIR